MQHKVYNDEIILDKTSHLTQMHLLPLLVNVSSRSVEATIVHGENMDYLCGIRPGPDGLTARVLKVCSTHILLIRVLTSYQK